METEIVAKRRGKQVKTTRKITNRRELRTAVLRSFTFLSIAGGTGIYTRFCGKRNTFHASKVRVWSFSTHWLSRVRVRVFHDNKEIKKTFNNVNYGFSFRYRIRDPAWKIARARQIAFKSSNDRAITTFDRSLLSRGRDSFFPFINEGGTRALGELETQGFLSAFSRVHFFLFLLFFQIARRLKINWHPGARSG